MNRIFLLILGVCFIGMINSCDKTDDTTTNGDAENPFLTEWDTPYGVPPFEEIKLEHYKPAFEKAIEEQKSEIDAIIKNEDSPNFINTIEALESSGQLMNKVQAVFYNLNSANTNDEMQNLASEMAPLLSSHNDDIMLNKALFERIKTVYDSYNNPDNSASDLTNNEAPNPKSLTDEQKMLLEKTYKNFTRSGALLAEKEQDELRELNKKLSGLTIKFGQNVLSETNKFKLVIENKDDLSGLPDGLISAAADEAKSAGMDGKWIFTLQNPSLLPFLQYADNRELRKKIWDAYKSRGDNNDEFDNKKVISDLVELRAKKAKLLGYESHAHYIHEEAMAKNPDNVYKLLDKVWAPAIEVAKTELKDMQDLIKSEGKDFNLEPWDWRYYAEKIRQKRYSLDEEEMKKYFSLESVREGIFHVVNMLYDLTFEKIEDIPVYHEDVTAYEVKRKGEHIGVLYMDFHPRESKRGGAWMTSYRKQSTKDGDRVHPVISIVCNFSKPTGDAPALLTFDEVTTFFHEFGHAIHGLMSNVNYNSLSGTSVPRDFVELPSQVLENWAGEKEVMKVYAKHYKNGEIIPDEIVKKMEESQYFNQGFATVEYLAASYLDLAYHTRKEGLNKGVSEFEKDEMKKLGLIDEIIPRYRSNYFQHIFAGGYSASYYSYMWSELLDADAFQAFKETSLYDRKTADAFSKNILEMGGTVAPDELYRRFRGKDPDVTPLLKRRGLLK